MASDRGVVVFYRTVFRTCFWVLLFVTLSLLAWIGFSEMATSEPMVRSIVLRERVSIGMAVALLLYFKWPWASMIVSWIDIIMVFRGMLFWEEKGIENLFYQFSFDLLFFFAAHLGVISFLLLARKSRTSTNISL